MSQNIVIGRANTHNTIGIAESVHPIYKQLTTGNDLLESPFHTMKDVFMWAAALGYEIGERRPIVGKRIEIFNKSVFNTHIDLPLLKALAISTTGDVNILQNQDDILSIAEEYANAGLYELRGHLLEDTGQSLWNLINMVLSNN